MAKIDYKFGPYNFGDEMRSRLTWVTGSGLRTGNPTARLKGIAAPQPLSQYPEGSDVAGYRLEHTERGHIIGLQFGGPEVKYNLVPMYAGFNGGSGVWGQTELKIKKWLDQRHNRSLGMAVSIGYDTADAATPTSFGVTFHSQCGDDLPFEVFGGFNFYVHPPAHIARDDPDEDDLIRLDILKIGQKFMMSEKWFIEQSGQISVGGSGRSLRSGVQNIPVAVGGVDLTKFNLDSETGLRAAYASRPYAVLDYLWFKYRDVYSNKLGFGRVTRFDNTQPFSEVQKSAIRKVNILAHLGYMVSDLYGLAEEEEYHSLYIGSADASAQVDHITGKAGAGSNCYSNARLVSKKMNLALNRTGMQEKINGLYEDPKNWDAMAKRLMAFWTGL